MSSVQVRLGNENFEGWKTVSVSRSIESFCGTFEISMYDSNADQELKLVPNTEVDIIIDGTSVMRGLIDRVQSSLASRQNELVISGRDKTSVLVDCSATNLPGKWNSIGFRTLATQLSNPFNITVRTDTTFGANFDFKLQTGESPFEALNRANEFEGKLLNTDTVGRFIITEPGFSSDPVTDKLIYGNNVIMADMTIDYSDRFSEYTVKGQTKIADNSGWQTEREVNYEATANDPAITTFRPKIFQSEGKADSQGAQRRADLEASVRAAKAAEIVVTVQGWRQSGGGLWPLNAFVFVDIPRFQLDNRKMLISGVSYTLSLNEGERTQITLKREDAFKRLVKKRVREGTANAFGW